MFARISPMFHWSVLYLPNIYEDMARDKGIEIVGLNCPQKMKKKGEDVYTISQIFIIIHK
jgi:hypothetical protein